MLPDVRSGGGQASCPRRCVSIASSMPFGVGVERWNGTAGHPLSPAVTARDARGEDWLALIREMFTFLPDLTLGLLGVCPHISQPFGACLTESSWGFAPSLCRHVHPCGFQPAGSCRRCCSSIVQRLCSWKKLGQISIISRITWPSSVETPFKASRDD